jgi:hypothetical protein
MLKDEIKINKFKNEKKKKQSQPALTFETGDCSHESETNHIEIKQKK